MIRVENLSKSFGPKRAVDGVTFNVERGEVLGFLGPNGAGKSTTMRMVTGYIPPTAGKVTVGDHDMWKDPIPAKALIGYLPENAPAYSDMTVRGFLSFAAEVRGITGAKNRKAVEEVAETCFLKNVLHQSIDTLSKGYLHRTCFAQSIIHDPAVLILDEPTDGLDPNQKHEVRNLIRRMGETKAIMVSTHILEEVEAVCSRAIIIDRGKVVANGTPEELKAKSHLAGSLVVRVGKATKEVFKSKLSSLDTVKSSELLDSEGSIVAARLFPSDKAKNGDLAESVAGLISKEGWSLKELHTEEGRLDDVFRNITKSDLVQEK